MAKSKKSDSKKASKDKDLKALKADKPVKEKKDKKKDKTEVEKAAPKPVKKAVVPKKVTATAIVFTTEEISLRAYFIAERRQAMGWSGDSSSDWVEAEKQLQAEAKKKAKL